MTLYFDVSSIKIFVVCAIAATCIGFVLGVIWRCVPMFIFIVQTIGD